MTEESNAGNPMGTGRKGVRISIENRDSTDDFTADQFPL